MVLLAARLRIVRVLRGWSVRELGRRSGISHAAVRKLEAGRQADVLVGSLERLAKAGGCSLDYLLGRRDARLEAEIRHRLYVDVAAGEKARAG